jgi:hypothetical protein
MHRAKAINPGRGSTAPADCRDQFGENIEAIFESTISIRLKNTKQLGFTHALDDIVSDSTVGLGCLRTSANDLGDGAGAR